MPFVSVVEHSGHHLHLACPIWPVNLCFSSDGRNSLCNIVSSSHQILAVRIIALSSTHSMCPVYQETKPDCYTWCSYLSDASRYWFYQKDIVINKIPTTPPWLLARPVVNLELHCYDKLFTCHCVSYYFY